MIYTKNRDVQSVLDRYAEHMRSRDISSLLHGWGKIAETVENEHEVDEYLNNMTVRKILEEISSVLNADEKASFQKELRLIDEKFRSKTLEVVTPFWVANNGAVRDYWFNYRAPQSLVDIEKLEVNLHGG